MIGPLIGAARLGMVAGAAQAKAEYVRARAMATASTAAGMARDVSDIGVRKAEEGISAAAQGAADTAANVQEAAGTVADQAQEAPGTVANQAKRATGIPAEIRPLSPVGGEPTSTGVPEPLPSELTPGEPGTGGPAGSSQAPSRPDNAETPTTGMEQPPVVDRMAEVAQRTSGHFIGNQTTRRYHAATSGHLPAERNRIYFETQDEAITAGFKPAENEGLDSAGS